MVSTKPRAVHIAAMAKCHNLLMERHSRDSMLVAGVDQGILRRVIAVGTDDGGIARSLRMCGRRLAMSASSSRPP